MHAAAALATLVAALQCRKTTALAHSDLHGAKAWLDNHLFNMSLLATTLPGGEQVWKAGGQSVRDVERFTLCFLGLGSNSIELLVALAQLLPDLRLVLLDVREQSWTKLLVELLQDPSSVGAAGRDRPSPHVELGSVDDFAEARGPERQACHAIAWSVDTPSFSFYRYRELFYSTPVVVAFLQLQGCTESTRDAGGGADDYYCEYLQNNYANSLCGKVTKGRGLDVMGERFDFPLVHAECFQSLCACSAYSDAYLDFDFESICRRGEHRFTGQWGQDRFLVQNIFGNDPSQHGRHRLYVDVGASHPYHLSNTAYFDACLGWSGVCVEPNPRSRPILQGLRSCRVVSGCAWANRTTMRFTNSDELAVRTDDDTLEPIRPNVFLSPGDTRPDKFFEATCLPLHDLLLEAAEQPESLGFPAGRPVIDFLSVDAEGAEIEIFRDFPFEQWDIRALVVETSRRTSMAVDSLVLPQGFVKVAILGKDAVYVHRDVARQLPDTFPVLPERIDYNELGSDAGTTPYMRFQRLFGVEGDLDTDVGDQRLDNESELERQRLRLDSQHQERRAKVAQKVRDTALGGVLTDERRMMMDAPKVQTALRDREVKAALAKLVTDELGFLRTLAENSRVRGHVRELLRAGVVRHAGASAMLGMEVPSQQNH